MAHSNNAVAAIEGEGSAHLYSFLGITAGKTYADISRSAFAYDVVANRWRTLPTVPVAAGRLASTAVGVGGKVFLFGGYTVAADGAEVSTPEVLAFDPVSERYERRADMPLPVDDSVAAAHGRYIYLVSGWHNDGNVHAVQVYDTAGDRWMRATDFPGMPVFGHAGGIAGGSIIVIDGVAVLGKTPEGRNRYGLVAQAWEGVIDSADPARIEWREIPRHRGAPLYRSAGGGRGDMVLFAGGSERAYNYDGIGYDGVPAEPGARVFGYDVKHGQWCDYASKPAASMDHRALLSAAGAVWTIGGMAAGQVVSGRVERFLTVAAGGDCMR